MKQHDKELLQHIVLHCEKIREYLKRCSNDRGQFMEDSMCQDACCMCVAQIGELSGLLSDEFREAHPELPWRVIKDTRNFYIHDYGNVNMEYVWNTCNEDIPKVLNVCATFLQEEDNE